MRKLVLACLLLIVILSGCAFNVSGALAGALEGDDAYRAGNYEKAIKEYKSCISSEGDTGKLSCWCSFMLGKVLLDKKQYSEAIPHLKRAADIDIAPGASCSTYGWRPAWYFWLGKAYYETQQFKDAIVAFEKAATLSADRLEQQIPNLQNVSPKDKEYYLSMLPRKSSCYFWLGSTYYRNAQYQEAVNALKQAIDLDPTAINFYIDLASSYRELKQYDNAMAAVKRSIEIKPSDDAYQILATIYTAQKQYDEAIGAYKKSIEINPKNATLYANIGNLFLQREDYSRAADNYKKAVELQPVNIDYIFSLANTYRVMGRYDDAISITDWGLKVWTSTGTGLEQAISIENGYPVVKTIYKDARAQVFEYGPAKKADIQVGDRIIKIDGQSTKGEDIAKLIQKMFGHAERQVTLTIERNGFKEPFTKVITQETYILKSGASFLALRSLIYREKSDFENALKDAEKAYSLDSADGWAQLSLGAAYLDRGKYDESIKLLSQIKVSSMARLLEATAYAKQGKAKEAAIIYLSIPEEEISPKNIPLMNDRMALLQTFKPIVKEHRDKARSFESNGQYKEALSELSEALKIADDTELQDIQETLFSMIRRNPLLSEVPEDARKYALRSEVMVKEGNFEQASTELKKAIQIAPYAARLYYNSALINAELKKYPEAIRHMKIYLKAAPDAPDARAAKDEIIKWEFIMERGNKEGNITDSEKASAASRIAAAYKTGTYKGVRTYENGDKYEGEFTNRNLNGKGTYTYANGDKYEGEFVDGKFTSKGTFTCNNGKQFTGNLENKVPLEFTIRCD